MRQKSPAAIEAERVVKLAEEAQRRARAEISLPGYATVLLWCGGVILAFTLMSAFYMLSAAESAVLIGFESRLPVDAEAEVRLGRDGGQQRTVRVPAGGRASAYFTTGLRPPWGGHVRVRLFSGAVILDRDWTIEEPNDGPSLSCSFTLSESIRQEDAFVCVPWTRPATAAP